VTPPIIAVTPPIIAVTPPPNVCGTPGCDTFGYSGTSAACANCQNCINSGGTWTGSSCFS
jgi:hypothetical protein